MLYQNSKLDIKMLTDTTSLKFISFEIEKCSK